MGDKAYRRNRKPTTTKGPWEPEPHQITKVVYNQITGTRDYTRSKRDRSDWKLVKQRPQHLRYPTSNYQNGFPPIQEIFTEDDMLPSGPGNSRAEFGPSRERSKKLTRVPTGGTLHHLLPRSYNMVFPGVERAALGSIVTAG